jgi:hypothetical protein
MPGRVRPGAAVVRVRGCSERRRRGAEIEPGVVERQAAGHAPARPASYLPSLESPERSQGSPASPDGLIERLGVADDALAVCESELAGAADLYRQARSDWLEINEGTDPELATAADMIAQRHLDPGARHVLAQLYRAESTQDAADRAVERARARRDTLLAAYDRLSDPVHPLTFDPEPDGLSPSDLTRANRLVTCFEPLEDVAGGVGEVGVEGEALTVDLDGR